MTAGANRQPTRPRRAHDDAVPAPARPGSGDPDRWTRLSAAAAGERGAQPRRICQLCVQTLGVTGAGICLVTDTGNRGVVCATGDVSGRIEDLQFTLGEGPCIEAVRAGAGRRPRRTARHRRGALADLPGAVSYTHLTLPT